MRTVTVKLSSPIVVGGKSVMEVVLRPSTIGDEEDALQDAVQLKRSQNPLSVEMLLLSRMASLPYDAMRGLPSADYLRIRDAYNSFALPDTPENPTEGGTRESS